jgi:hypothetical protein
MKIKRQFEHTSWLLTSGAHQAPWCSNNICFRVPGIDEIKKIRQEVFKIQKNFTNFSTFPVWTPNLGGKRMSNLQKNVCLTYF